MRNALLLIALVVTAPPSAAGCMWDFTEFVLKASMQAAEEPLLLDWIDGYLQAMTCFPRLHIITSDAQIDRARIVFARVPNVTVRANNYPASASQAWRAEGRSSLDPVAFVFMQWPMLWLDNFTSAPHVLTWDIDSLPVTTTAMPPPIRRRGAAAMVFHPPATGARPKA